KLIVIHPVLAGSSTNTDDPQSPEVALARFPVAIRVGERLFDRFLGKFVELTLTEIIALCEAEQLFPAVMPLRSAFYTRHLCSPLATVGAVYFEPARCSLSATTRSLKMDRPDNSIRHPYTNLRTIF